MTRCARDTHAKANPNFAFASHLADVGSPLPGSAICFPGTGVGGLNIRNFFSNFAVKRLKRGKIERQKRQKLALRFKPIAFHRDLLRLWIFAGLDFVRRVAGCSDSGHQRVKTAHRCTKF